MRTCPNIALSKNDVTVSTGNGYLSGERVPSFSGCKRCSHLWICENLAYKLLVQLQHRGPERVLQQLSLYGVVHLMPRFCRILVSLLLDDIGRPSCQWYL
ncbi:hypothetical protein AVEN_133360-1 [Araneus ventricosus]|uniref:Uncharacterized protein n=1 Tax=Araneus ventricosus TaxID=182803 RepID=A0A4Y2DMS0_ARAVE|nr:hypothetical protein AVEN_133360-1 [Araneus ventricosus]